jgi:hypothetical protein
MKLRADPTVSERVPFEAVDWVASPEAGVERKMLERDGDELARATSIVRYAAGSAFAAHVHDRGEEFLVLAGTFSDENGNYPAGSYVRNPPGSRHRPFSTDGCTLFVKLRQFAPGDTLQRSLRADEAAWSPDGATATRLLHTFGIERVRLIRLRAGSARPSMGARTTGPARGAPSFSSWTAMSRWTAPSAPAGRGYGVQRGSSGRGRDPTAPSGSRKVTCTPGSRRERRRDGRPE